MEKWRQTAPNLLTADSSTMRLHDISLTRASRGNGFPCGFSLLLDRSIDLRVPLWHAGEFVHCAGRPEDTRAPDLDLPELQSCRLSRGRLNGMRRCKCTLYTTPATPARCERMYGVREALYSVIQVYICRDGRVWRSSRRRARCSWDACCGGFRRRHGTGLVFRVFRNFSYGWVRDQRRLKVSNSGSGVAHGLGSGRCWVAGVINNVLVAKLGRRLGLASRRREGE
jgi:hypothetical protein